MLLQGALHLLACTRVKMFSLSVLAVLVGSVLASPTKRFDNLSVKLTGPASSVASVDELKFTAEVTNTGAEAVKILKYGTILDTLPTRSFTVTKDGEEVPFLSVSLENDNAFTTIASGETVTVAHELADVFDFATVGAGTFKFEPLVDLRVGGLEEEIASPAALAKVTVASQAIEITVTGEIAKREEKRAVSVCSNASRKSFIDASYTEAKELARLASSYVTSRGASDSLYRAYFKTNSASTISSRFNAVANENSSSRTLSCTDPYGYCPGGNVIAYMLVATTNIYYCDIFFREVASTSLCSGTTVASRNVRGGTTLHELTHAVASTTDVTYGCANDQALSASNQLRNADNYNCFATQVYQNTRC
ncbi:hypothetical protein VNI00_006377 [Paramarasmius palmivorus]|uniref:deuterolysin n=1 Tax=Paramarasmius palmivorus TaxID=297713 RepID=A0AAW0D8S1_9AGAR